MIQSCIGYLFLGVKYPSWKKKYSSWNQGKNKQKGLTNHSLGAKKYY